MQCNLLAGGICSSCWRTVAVWRSATEASQRLGSCKQAAELGFFCCCVDAVGEAILSQEVAELVGDACAVEQLPGRAVRLVEVANGTESHTQVCPMLGTSFASARARQLCSLCVGICLGNKLSSFFMGHPKLRLPPSMLNSAAQCRVTLGQMATTLLLEGQPKRLPRRLLHSRRCQTSCKAEHCR